MFYKKITTEDIKYFESILPATHICNSPEILAEYDHDYTEDFHFAPEIVLKPENSEQVSKILAYCNLYKIPVYPRGAGTGLSGGALAIEGGVCLSSEKLNRIIEIDEANFMATVEPGVINQVFQDTVAEKGLFYPPDPASKGSCFLGGNVAHSSGGPRALKYGTTNDYVLNLEVVLPNGEIIWTGANTLKYSTGYHLTQLMVGSEGTLGFVTKIVMKLLPLPKQNLLMLAAFASAEKACEAVAEIFRAGITPSALEFMERDAIDYSMQYTGANIEIPDWVQAHLLIEVDGNNLDQLFLDCEEINKVLERFEVGDVQFAESAAEKEKLWLLRRKVGEAVKSQSIYKEEDTVVPRAYLPQLLKGVKEIGAKFGFQSVCYGHAGDGNLHVNILKGKLTDEQWNNNIKTAIREIFQLCKSLGGTISGEHGIGYVQQEFMDIMFSDMHLELMRGIKKVFDPNNIMNPGKIFSVKN
ncbi:MAG: FAD-binding oxidoreductase [Bacteroidia bacterium]